MVVDIGGVGQGISELLQAVYTKPCCGFAAVLKLHFGFPNLGVSLRGVNDFLQITLG